MDFIDEMEERGLVAQLPHKEELRAHLKGGKRSAYIGFDPTAPSLHVGHLFQIMTLARWQRAGHRSIALMGGGTALIGDPTGKTEMRKVLTDAEIADNIAKYKPIFELFLDLKDPNSGIVVNNADWLKPLHYLPFLREIGSQFSVNRMLTADCFKTRLETGLSFIEFNYMLLQSYDFLHLYRAEKCTLQMGGDDQWSNMLSGMDLVRRMSQGQAFCLTTPLLVTSEGKKMGKTEKGAVWLDAKLTSPYEYFQYWRNVPDELCEPCLRYFTFMPMSEVRKLGALKGKDINQAKLVLAFETTKLLHGETAANAAKESASQLFGEKSAAGGDSTEPEFLISAADIGQGINIIDLLVKAQVFPSKGEARRLMGQGGLSLNGQQLSDINHIIKAADFAPAGSLLFRKGKKYYYRLRISG